MKNLATTNENEVTIVSGSEVYLSQRKLAEMCGVSQDTIYNFFLSRNIDVKQGVSSENAFLSVTYYAFESKAKNEVAKSTFKAVGSAGMTAFILTLGGYQLNAEPVNQDLTRKLEATQYQLEAFKAQSERFKVESVYAEKERKVVENCLAIKQMEVDELRVENLALRAVSAKAVRSSTKKSQAERDAERARKAEEKSWVPAYMLVKNTPWAFDLFYVRAEQCRLIERVGSGWIVTDWGLRMKFGRNVPSLIEGAGNCMRWDVRRGGEILGYLGIEKWGR